MKTTAPKFYCVRPNAAVVAPGESVQVQVILLGLTNEPAADFKCRDKFLVITLPAPYDLGSKSVADAWPELETEFKQQAVSKKIKVKYLLDSENVAGSQEQQAQQQEEKLQEKTTEHEEVPSTAGTQPATTTPHEANPVIDSLKGSVQEKKISSPVEKSPRQSVAEPETPSKSATPTKAEPVSAQEGSLNSTALILIAIIALVLGWLYY